VQPSGRPATSARKTDGIRSASHISATNERGSTSMLPWRCNPRVVTTETRRAPDTHDDRTSLQERKTMTARFKLTRVSALALSLTLAAPAFAQGAANVPSRTPQRGQTPADAPEPLQTGGASGRTGGDTNADRSVADIVVTGTRIVRSGFTTPTPLTVIGADVLQQRAANNIGEVLTQLPSFRATTSPTTSTVFGNSAYYADLRGLGPQRTLVLVDGRRFVPTSATGLVDLNLIPSIMVQRSEVVTGGASAAWGSDAVAGVLNLILKNNLDGIQAEAQRGISERGDDSNYKLALVAGTSFGGDRGHILVGGEYVDERGTGSLYTREWFKERHYLINANYAANGLPAFIWGNNVEHSSMTGGGLITGARQGSGPLVTTTPLYGTAFGAGGTPYQFQFGSLIAGQEMFGTGNYGFGPFMNTYFKLPVERYAGMGHIDYELGDAVTLFVEGSYAQSLGDFYGQPTKNQGFGAVNTGAQSPLTAFRENPFLPTSITSLMDAGGFTSLQLGRVNQDIGGVYGTRRSRTARGVAGANGTLGGSWTWDGYATYGVNKNREITNAQRIEANWRRAIDVVANPLGGAPICRDLLSTNPAIRTTAAGCVPYNIFGTDTASPAALAYVSGSSQLDQKTTQTAAAINVHGDLFSTWAGPVSVAAGVEYRRETIRATSDPLSRARAFSSRNPQPIAGRFNVKEVYGEVVVPLLRDFAVAKSLDLNGAVRLTDYSTSGSVTTWKAGATWELNDSIKLRGTYSRDIRAPNLTELFTPASSTIAILIDPFRQEQAVPNVFNTGNQSLRPEIGKTLTGGLVLQPSFIPQLQLSFDYYKIKLDGLIATTTPAVIVQRCFSGAQEFCSLISRGPAPSGSQFGTISAIQSPFLNLNRFDTRGLDIEASYRLPLDEVSPSLPGTLGLRFLGTYVWDYRRTDSAGSIDRSGQNLNFQDTGLIDFQATGIVSYDLGGFSGSVLLRYLNGGKLDAGAVPGTATGNNINHIDAALFTNLSLAYTVAASDRSKIQLFGYVSNLFDKAPPFPANEGLYYDVIGRAYRAGVRFTY
jgi:outer membrane receptor protein involved in Fe transport